MRKTSKKPVKITQEVKTVTITCDVCGKVHESNKPINHRATADGWIQCQYDRKFVDICSIDCIKTALDCGKDSPFEKIDRIVIN